MIIVVVVVDVVVELDEVVLVYMYAFNKLIYYSLDIVSICQLM